MNVIQSLRPRRKNVALKRYVLTFSSYIICEKMPQRFSRGDLGKNKSAKHQSRTVKDILPEQCPTNQ